MSIIFDIETGPLPADELKSLMPEFGPASVKVGNLKDQTKIDAKIADAKSSHEQSFLDGAALSAITGQVLCIGATSEHRSLILAGDECDILSSFWGKFDECLITARKMIGHNIHGFDIPFLVRRSWLLDVDVPDDVYISPYGIKVNDRVFIDTMKHWQLGVYSDKYMSLDTLARAFGIAGKPAEVTGKDFHKYWRGTTEQRKKAESYLLNDLEMTATVAEKMGLT